jgi:glycogen debranching enzyme
MAAYGPREAMPEGVSEVRLGRAVCGTLAEAERREWWLANGRGAYAAGTVAQTLTRRYHGLLVVPLAPPLGRFLVLAKADAVLLDGEREWPLHSNRWAGGAISPAGHVHMESFRLEGRMPVWRFAIGDRVLEQRIWMEPGRDVTYVAFRQVAGDARPRRVRVSLLADARDHHSVTGVGGLDPGVAVEGDLLTASHWSWFDLHVRVVGGRLRADHTWVERFHLPAEAERGLESVDNHLRVGEAELDLAPGRWCGLAVGLGGDLPLLRGADLPAALARFQEREGRLLERATDLAQAPGWVRRLVLAADAFLFARPLDEAPDGESVIAGYPWFGDWGRDTLIALPGLTLATGRRDGARRILTTFAGFVDRGMLPNVFPGRGERPAYNSVDAALWYVEAWRAYLDAGGDLQDLEGVFPVLEDIVRQHVQGTRYHIRMDPRDGLLWAGEEGVQLTWMDAKVGDGVVTPRAGKPVEVNALWHNALVVMAGLAERLGRDGGAYRDLSERAREGFQRFLRPDGLGLYDVLDGPDGLDASLRPNQVLAVSLHHSPLDPAAQAAVVAVCGRELLTSYGLRSLAADAPDYRPYYRGGVHERDGAYHQGPVWAWLLGHYALAEHRVTGDRKLALSRLAPIADHLTDAGLGTVSEIFDAAPPHHPRGAPAQAWSVACILEAWWRLAGGGEAGTDDAKGEGPHRGSAVALKGDLRRGAPAPAGPPSAEVLRSRPDPAEHGLCTGG